MGQAKRRRKELGDLYGTPEGSNQVGIVWSGISLDGQIALALQDVATADGRPWCICEPTAMDGEILFTATPPDEAGHLGMWVPPMKPGHRLRYRHPIAVKRSQLSGKWAVQIETSQGCHTLDVFHDLRVALRSAQNAQVVMGQASATEVDGPIFHTLVTKYANADKAEGIESDDEILGACEDSGDGTFRTLRATGPVPLDRLAPVVDNLRTAGLRVRLPDPVDPNA